MKKQKFWLRSAVFLGIGSMIWAWIFVLLWEAWDIAWNLVWISFILWGIIALLSWYSLAKLSQSFPSRGWIVEYLVQCYGEWIFSGTVSVLFYLSAMVAIAMVAKTFWTYLSVLIGYDTHIYTNIFSIGILAVFVIINSIGTSAIAKSENLIVIIKLSIILLFTVIISFSIDPNLLHFISANHIIIHTLSAVWLTFFAYEWFRVITNTVEDIKNPKKNIMKSMIIAILIVMWLYIAISLAIFWNLSLAEIIKAQDYVLAEAAKPVFWQIWFLVMWITALISTASSINANLYAVTNVTYNMAKNGELPKIYQRNIFHSTEGLIISSIIMSIMIFSLDLSAIASIWAISMLLIHLIIHIWHLIKVKKTQASVFLVILAILTISSTIVIALNYTSKHIHNLYFILAWSIILAFMIEILLRTLTKRVVKKQS